MKNLKSLLLILSIITSLVITGCSSSSEESSSSTENNGKETSTVRMAIDTAAGGSFQLSKQLKNKAISKKMVWKLNLLILLWE